MVNFVLVKMVSSLDFSVHSNIPDSNGINSSECDPYELPLLPDWRTLIGKYSLTNGRLPRPKV